MVEMILVSVFIILVGVGVVVIVVIRLVGCGSWICGSVSGCVDSVCRLVVKLRMFFCVLVVRVLVMI